MRSIEAVSKVESNSLKSCEGSELRVEIPAYILTISLGFHSLIFTPITFIVLSQTPRFRWFDHDSDMSEPSAEILSNSAALHALKRPQLNRLCKRFGVTAKGKVRRCLCDYKNRIDAFYIAEYRAY